VSPGRLTRATRIAARHSEGVTDSVRCAALGPALIECLTAATAAPSLHNSQPWLFEPGHGAIDVYADPRRQLAVIDPTGREMYLGVAAAVFNLRVAMAHHGRMPLLRLRPRRSEVNLLARVTPGPSTAVSATVQKLARAIDRRRSNRWPFLDLAVPSGVLADLVVAAATEGAILRPAGPAVRMLLLDLVRDAEREWGGAPAYREELAAWSRDRPDCGDGVPPFAMGPRSTGDTLPLRDFRLPGTAPPPRARFEARPSLAVLYGGDTPRQWLRAGQALQRVLLTATAHGIASSLLTQPFEIPELRDQLVEPSTGWPAQAIIRLGYTRRLAARSPRRPLSDVVLTPTILPDHAIRQGRRPS
jgi:nitroreductase